MISIENTQDGLMVDVKANITGLKSTGVFEGEFSENTLQQLLLLTPFVIGSYRMPSIDETQRTAAGGSGTKKHQFLLIIGSASLLGKSKAQRNCLSIIDDIVARYDGKTFTFDGSSVTFGLGSIEPLPGGPGLVVYGVSLIVYDE
jgi:hypothetical protein